MLAPGAIVAQGRLILATVEAGFAAAGVDLPDARYLAPGNAPPAMAEQLVVHLANITAGHPGQPAAQWQRPGFRTATWKISILRAVYVQGEDSAYAPNPLDIEVDAVAEWTDAAILQDLLERAKVGHTLAGPGVPITISPVIPDGPMGGLAGVQATASISLIEAPSR